MLNTIALLVAGLMAVGIMGIGSMYLAAPGRMTGKFGLKLPASDANTRAWLRLKGVRDLASGIVVLTVMLTTDSRTVGMVLLALAVTAFGDMSVVLGSGGSKVKAFSIHGATCLVMVMVGLVLIHVL